MSVARTYPHGVTCWVDTGQPDVEAAKRFYGGLFGWTFGDAQGGYSVAFTGADPVAGLGAGEPVWRTYVAVSSADEVCAAASAAGGVVVTPPADAGPAGRTAALRDPQGAEFQLLQPGPQPLAAQHVNAPGGWNFSDLRTSDPAAAFGFYAGLFGWHRAGFSGNDENDFMVQVPGYGDHLAATSDPGILERQQDAPDGFADVIGAIVPADPGEPPHWHVTFAVADRDASAADVARLGGTVLFTTESPWSRLARVRDPAGAEFTLSQFTPPESF